MSRGPYQAVEDVDRNRLVTAYTENRDYQNVARDLGIARQTARNIIVNFNLNGRVNRQLRGGTRRQKIDAEMEDYLIGEIQVKPTSTLKELKEQMIDLPDKPAVTHQAIS